MTEPGGVLLDRVQLERAFTALGERMVRRGVVADVFVVGGAAMALAYDATRVTRDVDSLFVPHGVVLERPSLGLADGYAVQERPACRRKHFTGRAQLTMRMGPPLNDSGSEAGIYRSRRRVTTPRPTSCPSQRLKWLPIPR